MRKYYFCDANETVYTENEKKKSFFTAHRFMLIGEFKNRRDAEEHFAKNNPYAAYCCPRNEKRI